MPGTTARRRAGAAIPAAALVALAAALTGCKGQVTSAAPAEPVTASAESVAPAAATSGAAPATASTGGTVATGGTASTGSLTASVTSPVAVSGTVATTVTCTAGLAYRAQAASAVVHGDQLSYTVAIARYRGPGSYPAIVAVTLRQPDGVVTTIAGVSQVPAAITAAGGSFSVSAAGSAGRTFTGSLSWRCGA